VRMIPPPVARAAAAIAEAAYRLRGKTPSVCRARVRTILHGHRYDGSRATLELGLEYTPVAETFARTIAWAVSEGLVTRPLPGRHPDAILPGDAEGRRAGAPDRRRAEPR
jgi:dihydroflavonol-4-reductase